VPEGKDVGLPVKLRPWQRRDIKKIYDNPHGTRRAIISFGKKNGKTSLAACLLLLHLCGPEAKPNTQLPSTAQSKDQAAVLFNLAAKMVRLNPELDAEQGGAVVIRDTVKQLFCPEMGTLYKALSAEVSTAHGQSPIFAIHDELGQVRGPVSELYNAIENAMGAHDAPLSIVISTQAPTDADLLSILIDDAQRGCDPSVVLSLYTADPDLDPFSEKAIKQANPAYGDFLNAKEIRKQAEDARRMPSQEPLYRNYTLNQRVEASSPFVSRSLWQSCGAAPADFGKDTPIYAGLDLSAVNDLTAFVPIGKIDGTWHVRPVFWLPGDGLAEKARKDRVPYDVWHKSGHLLAAPGKSVDYEFVATFLRGFCDAHNVKKIAFDAWGFRHLRPWLLKAGFTDEEIEAKFEEFRQGSKSMTPALRALETEILNGRIAHGNHPVLAMCAANAVVEGSEENRKLVKQKSSGRIDGMVALADAFGVAPLETEEEAGLDDYIAALASA
jgi:phage terminase large subunit-like protein